MTAKRKPLWSSGKGGLLTICLVLTASALIRLAGGTGPALAREMAALPQDAAYGDEQSRDGSMCEPGERVDAVLKSLMARSDQLKRREREIEARLQTLELAEREIAINLAALAEAEESLEATIALADGAAEDDIGRLTEVYQKMNPQEAAALFEAMDPSFSAGFLARMRPDAAASIMAGLSPAAAYTISIVLAGRNSNVPTE